MTDTANPATPVMSKDEAAAIIDAARIRKGLTWAQLANHLDAPVVWATAALHGKHPMTAGQAARVIGLFGLGTDVAEALTAQPLRAADPSVMSDPTIYRFHEALAVYGTAIKALIHEEFGDGIMSAINFKVDVTRRPDPEGDRVVVTFDGKFLDYRW